MVRHLLGNIKGPQGDIGPKGDVGEQGIAGPPGTLENEAIGVVNKIDITKLSARGGPTAMYDFEIDNGIVHYSDIEWYLRQEIELSGVKYVFRTEDYLTNPNFASGRLQILINDLSGNMVFSGFALKKTPLVIDLSGRELQKYDVQLRVTNTETFSGFIEKPMLVEGDISVLWSPPSKTQYYLHTNMSGAIPYSGNFSEKGTLTMLGSPEGWNSSTKELTLPGPGVYQIHVSVSPNTLKTGLVEVDICNGDVPLASVRGTSPNTIVAFAGISTITAIPRINVKVAQSIADESINARGSNSTKIFIKKLPN